MTLFSLRLEGCPGRSGTIFYQVCPFQSNLAKLCQNDPLTGFESFLTVDEGVGKAFTFFWVVQFSFAHSVYNKLNKLQYYVHIPRQFVDAENVPECTVS